VSSNVRPLGERAGDPDPGFKGALYRTVAAPDAVLALLERKGEGPPEVVVDPRMLTAVEQARPLHPERFRQDG
jgi:hypothetical protein